MSHYETQIQPVRFTVRSIACLRKKYKPGQVIYLREQEDLRRLGDDEDGSARKLRYTIAEVFPFHLSCYNESGIRESFNYVDLEKRRIK